MLLTSLATIFWAAFMGPSASSLVSIVHHALLQHVLREQGTSTGHLSYPGDICHLNFHLGHPAYLDLSVRCTTQSAVISSSASQAGVAAAGEGAKDNQYLDSVSKSGGDFIPLICESFGVWLPYAL